MTSKTNTKITISGFPRKFDKAELLKRQQGYRNVYKQTSQCMEIVRGDIAYNFLSIVIEKSNQGYVLSPNLPINIEALNHSCHMIKPQDIQEAEMLLLDEQVKLQYIAELEAELQQYRALLTQQLVEADEAKEQKKLEQAKAKRMTEIQKEVDSCFGDLAIPV